MLNYDNSSIKIGNSNKEINNSESFYKKWTGYLGNHSILESEVANANDESNKLINALEKEYDEHMCTFFVGNLIKFKENEAKLEPGVIGDVVFESLNLSKAIKRINKKENIISCEKFLEYFEDMFCDLLDLYKNRIYAIMSTTEHHVTNVFIVDYKCNLTKQINIQPPNGAVAVKYSSLGRIDKKKSLDLIILFTSYELDCGRMIGIARTFNQNLELLLEKEIKFNEKSIFIYDNNIYCLVGTDLDYNVVIVYDENLNEIDRHGQSDENLPFCFPSNSEEILVTVN